MLEDEKDPQTRKAKIADTLVHRLSTPKEYFGEFLLLLGHNNADVTALIKGNIIPGLRAKNDILPVLVNNWSKPANMQYVKCATTRGMVAVKQIKAALIREIKTLPVDAAFVDSFDKMSLHSCIKALYKQSPARVVLILDEFTAFFEHFPGIEERRPFINEIGACNEGEDVLVNCLLGVTLANMGRIREFCNIIASPLSRERIFQL
jgi:hypothetical protein